MMRFSRVSFQVVVGLIVFASFVFLVARGRPGARQGAIEPVLVTAGLHQPRGLDIASDGTLYVAEAGFVSPTETPTAGRVYRLSPTGVRGPILDGLPAASSSQPLFAQSGPAALVRAPGGGDTTLLLFTGPAAGQPLGAVSLLQPGAPQWRSELLAAPGPALSDVAGPAAAWGGALTPEGAVYVTYPAANQLIRLTAADPAGAPPLDVARVTGFVDSGQRNPFPTAAAAASDGTLYVSLFGAEPFRAGTGRVVRVAPDGKWQPLYESLNFPIALAFGPGGQLYVLEFASGFDARTARFTPNSGRLLAVGPAPARRRTVVAAINYPTALRFSATGDAFMTENGAFSHPGEGRILRVTAQALRTVR